MQDKNWKPHIQLIKTLILLSLVWLAYRKPVLAIECNPPDPPADEYNEHDAVFTGRPTAIICKPHLPGTLSRFLYTYAPGFYDSTYCRVYFSVDKSWKGVTTTNAIVITYNVPYGPGFSMGQHYLVYANRTSSRFGSDGVWFTGPLYCTRTTVVSEATEDFNYLQTIPELELIPTTSPVVWFGVGIISITLFLFVVLLTILQFRRAASGGQRPPRL